MALYHARVGFKGLQKDENILDQFLSAHPVVDMRLKHVLQMWRLSVQPLVYKVACDAGILVSYQCLAFSTVRWQYIWYSPHQSTETDLVTLLRKNQTQWPPVYDMS